MNCIFCQSPMNSHSTDSTINYFDRYACVGCQPPADTFYARIYFHGEPDDLIQERIRIDEYSIVREYEHGMQTSFYRRSGGIDVLACRINGIVDLPFHDVKLLKSKLKMYITFS